MARCKRSRKINISIEYIPSGGSKGNGRTGRSEVCLGRQRHCRVEVGQLETPIVI